MSLLVKICGLTRREDVETAIQAGATHLGFVLTPRSRRYVTLEQLRKLTRGLGTNVKKVGVFVDAEPPFISQAISDGSLDILQLHGHENAAFIRQLPPLEIWKAFHLTDETCLQEALSFPADKILTDAKEGGSGQCCNWAQVARLVQQRSVILAGGITPDNVIEALRTTRACGIDLSTGVEIKPGIKSKEKIEQLFNHLKQL